MTNENHPFALITNKASDPEPTTINNRGYRNLNNPQNGQAQKNDQSTTESSKAEGRSDIGGDWLTPDEKAGQFLMSQRMRNFSDEVSIVGLRYTLRGSVNWARKTMWTFLIVFGLGFMLYQIQDRISYYLTRPTSVNFNVNYNDSVVFPTITICNENIALKYKAEELGLDAIIAELFPPVATDNTTVDYTVLDGFGDIDWLDLYTNLSQTAEEAIIECTWEGRSCDHTWFSSVYTDIGVCYQFNPNKHFTSRRAGAANGLHMLMFVDQSNYLAVASFSAGFRVLLHAPEDPPLMEEWAFKVTPGAQTLVGVTMKKIVQLPPPYGTCEQEEDYVYTKCILQCKSEYVIDKCGCKDMNMFGNASICTPVEGAECLKPAVADYIASGAQDECLCGQQCDRTVYTYALSHAASSEFVVDFLANNLLGVTTDTVKQDFLILDIFFSEIAYEEMTTKVGYTFLALLCDVGGAMGLILGSTLLTVFEIADFAAITLRDLFVYWKAKKTERKIASKS